MVSTDDEEIAEIAKEYGASVPFLRSENNSDDHATSADVLSEVLFEYRSRDSEFDILACIYPTAPFITAEELRNAAKLLTNTDTSSVVAVTDFDFPPQRAFLLSDDAISLGSVRRMRLRGVRICREPLMIAVAFILRVRHRGNGSVPL